jgi:small subunit ribosomal protein S17
MAEKKTSKAGSGAKPGGAKPGGAKSVPPPPKSTKGVSKARAKAAAAGGAPAPAAPVAQIGELKTHSFRRKMIGTITSDKMNKTVVVEVIRKAMDPVYKKYIRVRDRYKAHDELNQYKVGDRVEITEHRPISRDKRWLVTRLLTRRVEA